MKKEKKKKFPIILTGGGPACISAAIQLIRNGVNILLITKEIGGLVKNANLIENLLGFPNGISGLDFVKLMKRQIKIHKIPILKDEVTYIEQIDDFYVLTTSNNTKKYKTNNLIIGTGTIPKKLNIEGEVKAFNDKKLFYEVSKLKTKLNLTKSIEIVIVGSGDAAYDYALNLSPHVKSIKIIQRKSSKALKLLQNRVNNVENISIKEKKTLIEIKHSENGLYLEFSTKAGKELINTDILLVAIGRIPNNKFLSKKLLRESLNINKILFPSNIYLIGDIKNKNYRQISIAQADGVKVATIISKRLKLK